MSVISTQNSPVNRYNLQFSYLKRKATRQKNRDVGSVIDSHTNRYVEDLCSSVGSYLHQSIPLTGDRIAVKSLSLSLNKRIKQKERDRESFTLRQQENPVVIRSFPKRKQKGKELHFFKMLRRYTEQSRLIEQAKSKIQLFSKQKDIYSGLRPHLKTKQMQAVPKERYCLNRRRQGQNRQSKQRVDFGKSLVSIKVNPVKRNI